MKQEHPVKTLPSNKNKSVMSTKGEKKYRFGVITEVDVHVVFLLDWVNNCTRPVIWEFPVLYPLESKTRVVTVGHASYVFHHESR